MAADLEAPPVRPDGLQLDERRSFQRKFWRVERIGWLLFTGLILCALAGLAGGGGYFSRQSVAAGGSLLDLPRIAHAQGDDRISILAEGDGASLSIVFDEAFSRHFLIEGMQPAAERSAMVSGGFELVFARSGEGPSRVLIDIRPLRPGYAAVGISVDGERARAGILVLP